MRQYERAMAKASGTANKTAGDIERRFKRAESNLANFGRTFSSVLGIGLGAHGLLQLGRFIGSAVSDIANLADKADEAGTSIKNLQTLTSAGIGSGLDEEQIIRTLATLNDKLSEAEKQGNRLGEIFKANGLAIRDQNGNYIDAVVQLENIANLVKNAGSHQERLNIVTEIWGDKIGRKLIPLLVQGGEKISEMRRIAEEAGDAIDEGLVKRAEQFDDAWNQAMNSFSIRVKTGIFEAATDMTAFLNLMKQALSILPGFTAFGSLIELSQDVNRAFIKSGQGPIFGKLGQRPDIGSLGAQAVGHARSGKRTVLPVDPIKGLGTAHETAAKSATKHAAATKDFTASIGDIPESVDEAKSSMEELEQLGDIVASNLERAFDEFIDSGKIKWKDFARSLVKDFASFGFRGLLGSAGGDGGGILGALFGAFGGSVNAGGGGIGGSLLTGISGGAVGPMSNLGGASLVQVQAVPGPYFDLHVTSIADHRAKTHVAQGMNTARKRLPTQQARFAQLGTTGSG